MHHHPSPLAPRDFTPGAGLPGDRGARVAARQAFVGLKHSFLDALQAAPAADWLRMQVRAAEEPVDLWLLRAPVFAALGGMDDDCRAHRQRLHRSLDTVFPDLDSGSTFMTL
ncbi:MAG: hypothetical protein C0505_05910 [Leptothrix sp. (in: Bacteria)]|nr:hypothetical protein [Leptothrix sp. (in: b-proteobacteria)]